MIRPTYPENPVIAKFFKEIGRVDEVGSGVRNTFKYCGIYTPGTKQEFIEENIFKTIIPLEANESEEVVSAPNWGEVWRKVRGSSEKIVELIFGDQYIFAPEMTEITGSTEER